MPAAKTPALLKTEMLAQFGNRLANLPALVKGAAKLLTDGSPADESRNVPAIDAAELTALVGDDVAAKIKAAAAALD